MQLTTCSGTMNEQSSSEAARDATDVSFGTGRVAFAIINTERKVDKKKKE